MARFAIYLTIELTCNYLVDFDNLEFAKTIKSLAISGWVVIELSDELEAWRVLRFFNLRWIMPTLREKQSKFARMAAELILKACELGYEVTLGDAFRDPRLHGEMGVKKGYGAANSFHKTRLAIDLNLFKDGKFLGTTDDHKKLGEWWESKGGTWGGRFKDGNHYSLGE